MEPRMTKQQALAMRDTVTRAFEYSDAASDLTDEGIAQMVENGRRAMAGRPSLTAPGKHSPQVTVRLSQAMEERLEQFSRATGQRRSDVVREALDQFLVNA